MTIYYFSYNGEAPSFRYRGRYLLETLERKYGIPSRVFFPPTKKAALPLLFLLASLMIRRNTRDVFVFQKICSNDRYAHILLHIMRRVRHSIYDLDDAMQEIKKTQIIEQFVRGCSLVTMASDALVKYGKTLNQNTVLLTTPLPRPQDTKVTKNDSFTIGWIGVYRNVHIDNLDHLLFPLLKRIDFPITFKLVGITNDQDEEKVRSIFRDSPHIRLVLPRDIDWDDENAVNREIATFDIGTDPMFDNEINRSKSAFKIKQYLACGVPTLASPVGENKRFIREGYNGSLCTDTEGWLRAVNFFHDLDAATYQTYINHCKESYETGGFQLEQAADRFYGLISQCTEARPEHQEKR